MAQKDLADIQHEVEQRQKRQQGDRRVVQKGRTIYAKAARDAVTKRNQNAADKAAGKASQDSKKPTSQPKPPQINLVH
ncbi:hypothetical protein K469DRAFT_721028 [Zopfia rhizophila CBS 207.26]|uniref:Uncharacterized protein n=1 Tax=Zopfia rhizophila CBS 207.26 TaxID=1314779 RepID=A0A6A6DHK9_9PEZI|nr:hypothetical protein K469DRAFT_721028 [Zopfia rhizophila CBS 207.26]